MKIKSTFKFVLEPHGEEPAEFVFRSPKANTILKLQGDSDDPKKNLYMLTDDLVSVKGLYNEDGSEVTAKDISSLDLDYITIRAILEGYNQAAFPKKAEDLEKKDS